MLDLLAALISLLAATWDTLVKMTAAAAGYQLPPKPPQLSPVALAGLATVLADLYPTLYDLLRLLSWAAIDDKFVPLDYTAINRWHFTLRHAQAQAQLGLLVRLALEEHPGHTELTYYNQKLNPEAPHG